MARNYLVFLVGLVVLLAFSFVFCYDAIYSAVLLAGILAVVGYLAALIISLIIGVASREEGGTLYVFFYILFGITAVVFLWFLTRAGTLLQIW